MFLEAFELCIGVLIVQFDSLESIFVLVLSLTIDSLCFFGDLQLELLDFLELFLIRGISFSLTMTLFSLGSLILFLMPFELVPESMSVFFLPLFLLILGSDILLGCLTSL
jgi:hypothetical protein